LACAHDFAIRQAKERVQELYGAIRTRVDATLYRYDESVRDAQDGSSVLEAARENWEHLDHFSQMKQVRVVGVV
jgi:hypothetical protein